MNRAHASTVPGYTYGSPQVARSPVSDADLRALLGSIHFGEEDRGALRDACAILARHEDDAFAHWIGLFGDTFVATFEGPDGTVDERYREVVGRRARRWFHDLCERPWDRAWLDYQHEIGLRHHRTKKGRTDGLGAVPHVAARYLISFIHHTADVRALLAREVSDPEALDRMQAAWSKAITVQVALWLYPYCKDGDW